MTDPNAFTLGLIAGTFAGFLIALAVCHVADRIAMKRIDP